MGPTLVVFLLRLSSIIHRLDTNIFQALFITATNIFQGVIFQGVEAGAPHHTFSEAGWKQGVLVACAISTFLIDGIT